MKRFLALTVMATLLFTISTAAAEDITILDTSGTVRAQTELASTEQGVVTMKVEDTATGGPVADGTEIVLTPANGSPIVGVVSGGEVVFQGLTAQSFTVSSTSAVTFTGVSIVAVPTGTTVAGATALGGSTIGGVGAGTVLAGAGAVAVIGGTTVAIVESNNNNDSKAPLSPFR